MSLKKRVADETASNSPALVKRVAAVMEANGLDPDDLGKVSQITLSNYQGMIKDEDGEPQVVDLEASRIVISPKWESGPEWPVVQQPAPVTIKSNPSKAKKADEHWRLAVILPDTQIGYYHYEDGEVDPFHDDRAINCAKSVVNYLQRKYGVDQVVWLGDFLDLPEQSRWAQEPQFARTTQMSVDYGYRLLSEVRALAPDAHHVLVEGNHDKRLGDYAKRNAMASFGLRRADAPESWPVLSIPYLLRLNELEIQYIDAYPAGEFWINDRLRAIHGKKVNSGGSTANLTVKDSPNISTIFGHIHRIEMQYRTIHDRSGPIRSVGFSPGCLSRVDGAVPSFHSATHLDGRPAVHWENWQQGMGVVWYHPDGRFHIIPIHIMNGWTVFEGNEFSDAVL